MTAAINQAAALLRAGDAAGALAAAGRAKGGDAAYIRAMALGALGRLAEADAAFAEAIKQGASRAEARRNQGTAHRRAGDPAAALRWYDEADKAGAPPALLLDRALALKELGRPNEALAAYEAYLAGTPDDPAALSSYGGLLTAQGRHEDARAALDRSLSLRPGSPIALNNRASLARAAGEQGELDLLRRAAALAPANPDILANRARAAARRGEEEEAIQSFAAAVRAAPTRADIHRDLNRFLAERGRADLFLQSYQAVPPAAPGPERAALLADAAKLAGDAGDHDGARERYDQALGADPGHAPALAGRARLADGSDAPSLWQAALAAAPLSGEVRLGYGWHLLKACEWEEAERVLAWPAAPEHTQERLAYDAVAARMLGRDRYAESYDLDRLTTLQPLAVPPRYGSLALFMEAIEEALAPLFVTKAAPPGQTLFGGVQSPGNLWETSAPALLDLKAAMLSAAQAFWDEVKAGPPCPATRAAGAGPLSYAGAWSVRLTSGGGHTDHVHPQGTLSSAHYVTVPTFTGGEGERPGWLRLGRPPLDHPQLTAERVIEPRPGHIALFPSYVWHGVEAFEAEAPRVTTPADFRAV